MAAGMLQVEVVHALPGRCWRVSLALPAGSTVADALAAADMPSRIEGLVVDAARLAVFGQKAAPGTVLHDRDRVEILRPLLADPKQARRARARDAAKR